MSLLAASTPSPSDCVYGVSGVSYIETRYELTSESSRAAPGSFSLRRKAPFAREPQVQLVQQVVRDDLRLEQPVLDAGRQSELQPALGSELAVPEVWDHDAGCVEHVHRRPLVHLDGARQLARDARHRARVKGLALADADAPECVQQARLADVRHPDNEHLQIRQRVAALARDRHGRLQQRAHIGVNGRVRKVYPLAGQVAEGAAEGLRSARHMRTQLEGRIQLTAS